MVTIMQLTDGLKSYIVTQVDTFAKDVPMISFLKPIINRVINKNFSKITKTLDLLADEEGNIDIENIITEMADSIMNTNPFTVNAPFTGDIEIGGGFIKLNIPLTDKKLIFNTQDLEALKEVLTAKE